jgi:hypothetical protein
MIWQEVQGSELVGRLCYVRSYNDRQSGYGMIKAIYENLPGDRLFDVLKADNPAGRYIYPREKVRVVRKWRRHKDKGEFVPDQFDVWVGRTWRVVGFPSHPARFYRHPETGRKVPFLKLEA